VPASIRFFLSWTS